MQTFPQFESVCTVHILRVQHHTASRSGHGSVYMSSCYSPVSSESLHYMWGNVLRLIQSTERNHTPERLGADVPCHTASPECACHQGPVLPTSHAAPSNRTGSSCTVIPHARLACKAHRSRTCNVNTAPCLSHPSPSHTCG